MRGKAYFFKKALSWSRISSGKFSLRYHDSGSTYDSTAPSIFIQGERELSTLTFLNGKIVAHLLAAISPTVDFRITNIGRLPLLPIGTVQRVQIENNAQRLIQIHQLDWNSYETSMSFTSLPLQNTIDDSPKLRSVIKSLFARWQEITLEMQQLEEENNRIFIEAYDLQNELTPEVPLKEITLTCNPHNRYGGDKSDDELDKMLLADTMREVISYAVGCIFGRYSLDKPGLLLANQGESNDDYKRQVPTPSFVPDNDNVIPLLDGDWFADDISARFFEFLKVTFGDNHYAENLKFIEEALGKNIRKYFLTDFYKQHIKMYKKRPIYWLFSSPKGSFNALIYMHRYTPDTVSIILNGYLREYQTKLRSRKDRQTAMSISSSLSAGEKTKALKEVERINKILAELEGYERDTMYPLATQQIDIDLDDGVKENYNKFGNALKKIPGLN